MGSVIDENRVEIGIASNYEYEAEEEDLERIPLAELNKCASEFVVSYDWYLILISIALLMFGLFLTLSGYRAFRFCMWLSGALFASVAVLGWVIYISNLGVF